MKKVKKKMNWKKILSIVVVVTLIQPIFSKMGVLNALAENIVEDSGVTMENQLDLKDVPTFVTSEHIEEYGHTMRLYEKETELNTVVFQNSNGTQTVYYTVPLSFNVKSISFNSPFSSMYLSGYPI